MKIADILAPDMVKYTSGCTSKKRVFQIASELAGQQIGEPSGEIYRALNEREALGSTGAGHGVALPHARLTKLDKIMGVFIRLNKPVDFEAADKRGVDLVFTLLAPLDANVMHLRALAAVSRRFRDETFCDLLRSNSDPAALYALLTDDLVAAPAI